MKTLETLCRYDLVYLGTPYSKYPKGLERAFVDACKLVGHLLLRGVRVYSPIAHGHPVSLHAGIDPLSHAIWLPFNLAIINKSDAFLVARMEGWADSYGIGEEIKLFNEARKPIHHLDPGTLELIHAEKR